MLEAERFDAQIRLALRPRDAAAAIGLSHRAVQALIADPTSGFPFKRVGRAVLVPVRELADWLADRSECDTDTE